MEQSIPATFRAIDEPKPGERWRSAWNELRPAYERWFVREGESARPSYGECRRAIRQHMPQLAPTYDRIVELAGGGDRVARLLSLWKPTPYLAACSQAVCPDPEDGPISDATLTDAAGFALDLRNTPASAHSPELAMALRQISVAKSGASTHPQRALAGARAQRMALVRNYDYAPQLCEMMLWRTNWLRPVLAMSDCLWGVLDGINDAGLAISLAFGGRRVVGEGFGIPVVLRFTLETCQTTAEAVRVLGRVPVHMAYNVTVLDKAGEFATVFLSPDRSPIVSRSAIATNHQNGIEWPTYARATSTQERERVLQSLLATPGVSVRSLLAAMLSPPLYSSGHNDGWGTLYTAAYRPSDSSVQMCWPTVSHRQSLDAFSEGAWPIEMGRATLRR